MAHMANDGIDDTKIRKPDEAPGTKRGREDQVPSSHIIRTYQR